MAENLSNGFGNDSMPPPAQGARQQAFDLFLVGFLVLFLELACIRWFAANVIFLQFFTNVVLLACFLLSGTLEYIYFHRWLGTQLAPDWSVQIDAWQSDHTRELFVSPKDWPGFTLP